VNLSTFLFNDSVRLFASATGLQLLEEVVALVVNEDECREVFHTDFPYGFHAEFRIFHTFDALDVFLCEKSSRTTDRAKIETAMLLASVGHLL